SGESKPVHDPVGQTARSIQARWPSLGFNRHSSIWDSAYASGFRAGHSSTRGLVAPGFLVLLRPGRGPFGDRGPGGPTAQVTGARCSEVRGVPLIVMVPVRHRLWPGGEPFASRNSHWAG